MAELTYKEQQLLFAIVRKTIEAKLNNESQPDFSQVNIPLLDEQRGVFVTLKLGKQLKGCIGMIMSDQPLRKTLPDMAMQSAFNDPRFTPLTKEEYTYVHVEVSILTRPQKLEDFDQIEVGKHGLIVSQGNHKGLLLPQVAVEQNWDSRTFLQHTCMKANLPPDAYKKPDTTVEQFSAEVYNE